MGPSVSNGPKRDPNGPRLGWLITAQHENEIAPEHNPALACSEQNAALALREAVLGLRWRWVALCAELRWRILRWGCAGAEVVLALGCAGAGLLLRWLVLRSIAGQGFVLALNQFISIATAAGNTRHGAWQETRLNSNTNSHSQIRQAGLRLRWRQAALALGCAVCWAALADRALEGSAQNAALALRKAVLSCVCAGLR